MIILVHSFRVLVLEFIVFVLVCDSEADIPCERALQRKAIPFMAAKKQRQSKEQESRKELWTAMY